MTQFSMIPTEMSEKLKNKELNPLDVAVYFAIDSHANANTAKAWPSIATIARESGLSVSTVKRSITRLTEARCINKQHCYEPNSKEYSTNLYTLLFRTNKKMVGSQETEVSSLRTEGFVPIDPEVGSDGARNQKHITTTIKPHPPTPPRGTPPPTLEGESASDAAQHSPVSELSAAPDPQRPMAQIHAQGKSQNDGAAGSGKREHYDRIEHHFQRIWSQYSDVRADGEEGARRAFKKLFPFGREEQYYRLILGRIDKRLSTLIDDVAEGRKKKQFVPKLQNFLNDEDFSHD